MSDNVNTLSAASRLLLIIFLAAFSVALALLLLAPWPQDPAYHHFADQRTMLGIPNALNVLSNIPFLLVPLLAWSKGPNLRKRLASGDRLAPAIVYAAGMVLTTIGSSLYHWNPNNDTLLLDRGGMVIALMATVALLIGDFAGTNVNASLVSAELLGIGSVLWWRVSDDLRLYGVVQFLPGLLMIVLPLLFRSRYTGTWKFILVIGLYAIAKVCETFDRVIYSALSLRISGHSLKHLTAAGASLVIWWWVSGRRVQATCDGNLSL